MIDPVAYFSDDKCFAASLAASLAPSKQQAIGETSYDHRMTQCVRRSCVALGVVSQRSIPWLATAAYTMLYSPERNATWLDPSPYLNRSPRMAGVAVRCHTRERRCLAVPIALTTPDTGNA